MEVSWTHCQLRCRDSDGLGSGDSLIPGLSRRPDPRIVIRALAGLRHWSNREDLDVIVTNSATASALVRLAGTRVPVVYFCHGLHWNETRSIGDRVWPVIESHAVPHCWRHLAQLGRPALVLLNTSTAAVNCTCPRASASTWPTTPSESCRNGPLRLCWIGEFSTRKRPLLALDTAAELQRRGIDFHLEMLARGTWPHAIRAEISDRGLSGIVSADGPGDAAATLARSHALVLHTAQWEGLPRVMLESLAIGRGSYAFDVKGVRDIPLSQLTTDGDTPELAARIDADWDSGRLREPLVFDRVVLDYSHAATGIRQFLPKFIGVASTTPAVQEDPHVE